MAEDELRPLEQRTRLKNLLLLFDLDLEVRRDKVDEEARALDVGDRVGRLARKVRGEVDDLDREFLDGPDARREFGRVVARLLRRLLVDGRDAGAQVGLGLRVRLDVDPALALDDDAHRAVGHLDELEDRRGRARQKEVVRAGRLDVGALLGDDGHEPVARVGVADQLEARVAADCDREDDPGEEDGVAQRKNRERLGQACRRVRALLVGREQGNGLFEVVVGCVVVEAKRGRVEEHGFGEGPEGQRRTGRPVN